MEAYLENKQIDKQKQNSSESLKQPWIHKQKNKSKIVKGVTIFHFKLYYTAIVKNKTKLKGIGTKTDKLIEIKLKAQI